MSVHDKAIESPRSLTGRLARYGLGKRVGTVLDSERGEIECALFETPGIRITGADLPTTTVPYRLTDADATIGARKVTLRAGRDMIRRASHTSRAVLDGREYRLRPSSLRRAEFRRGDDVLAVLRRPWRSPRTVVWARTASVEEAALAHALAAFRGVGAPGAVLNLVRIVLDLVSF
jgi:hypothetical protein